jgi:hypothetical protein
MRACLKVAWDLWEPAHYVNYIDVIQLVRESDMLKYFQHDYQSIEPVLVNVANICHRVVCKQ